MKNYLLLILPLFIFLSCKKDKEFVNHIEDGVYKGTFQRKSGSEDAQTSNITLTFSSNKWNGSSNISKYPALCSGTYSIEGNSIIFTDECVWTADFDWSLILSGKYDLSKSGNSLEFNRSNNSTTSESYVDNFVLTKQE